MNGGLLQPGCKLPPVDQVKGQIKGIADEAIGYEQIRGVND
jgi:hypothetical protein